ncbi:MAG: hypothetical protein ABFD89_03850 [Bryobacteraceae bacterium]
MTNPTLPCGRGTLPSPRGFTSAQCRFSVLLVLLVGLAACSTVRAAGPPPILRNTYTTNTDPVINQIVINIASNAAWNMGDSLSNLVWQIGQNDTNHADAIGAACSNLAWQIGSDLTNYAASLVGGTNTVLASNFFAWYATITNFAAINATNVNLYASNLNAQFSIFAYLLATNATNFYLTVSNAYRMDTNLNDYAGNEYVTADYVQGFLTRETQFYFRASITNTATNACWFLSEIFNPTNTTNTSYLMTNNEYSATFLGTNQQVSAIANGNAVVDFDADVTTGTAVVRPELYLTTNGVTDVEFAEGNQINLTTTRGHFTSIIVIPTNVPVADGTLLKVAFKTLSQTGGPKRLEIYTGSNAVSGITLPGIIVDTLGFVRKTGDTMTGDLIEKASISCSNTVTGSNLVSHYNVKWFGARGDDFTDDTAAWQRALDVVSNGQAVLEVPEGVYRVGHLNGTTRSNFRIEGAFGPYRSILKGISNSAPILDLVDSLKYSINHIGFSSLAGSTQTCAMLIGRSTDSGSGGENTFRWIDVDGNFSVAGVYEIGSEINRWEHAIFHSSVPIPHTLFYGGQNATNIYGSPVQSYVPITEWKSGGSLNSFYDCQFLQASTNQASSDMVIEYAQNWIMQGGLVYSIGSTNGIILQNGIDGLTFNSVRWESVPICPKAFSFRGTNVARDIAIVGSNPFGITAETGSRIYGLRMTSSHWSGTNAVGEIMVDVDNIEDSLFLVNTNETDAGRWVSDPRYRVRTVARRVNFGSGPTNYITMPANQPVSVIAGDRWALGSNVSAMVLRASTGNAINTLQVMTTNNQTGLAVDTAGRVSVGVSSTTNAFEVRGGGKTQIVALDTNAFAQSVGASLILGGTYRGVGDSLPFTRISAEKANGTEFNYSYNLDFYTTSNGGTFPDQLPAMQINWDNKIGVGTTNPAKLFDVAGTTKAVSSVFTLSTNSAYSGVTNFVVNFDAQYSDLFAASDVNFLHTTNREAGIWKSAVIKLYTGPTNRQCWLNSSWSPIGSGTTNYTVLASNKVVILSFGQDGTQETNVAVVVVSQP